ncbi:hypothetical protein PROFUN_10983 [Planoprotostelium fungivorum]|uniref:Uncharacterized protein n=1 Tax=Planoprotostelium fungivorum TaxID=1890364 RepID=A0A2P6NBZ3_9EUKA|nr:hypothetical protein PROFUN_10983 [Planoprotostelium fungivorum]
MNSAFRWEHYIGVLPTGSFHCGSDSNSVQMGFTTYILRNKRGLGF